MDATCQRPSLKPLTSLRFFAALLVVLFHADEQFGAAALLHWPWPALEIFKAGYVGVGFFFVLSGFILAYNYLDGDFSETGRRREFWLARFARIYPVYLLGLLVALPKFMVSARDAGDGAAALNAVAALGLAQAWVPSFALNWNGPGWSLSAEAFFYLAFPFLVPLVQRVQTTGGVLRGLAFCWGCALLAPAAFCWLGGEAAGWSAVVKFNPFLRLPEFVFGVLLGRLFLSQQASSHSNVRALPGGRVAEVAGVLIITVLLCRDHLPRPMLHNGLLAPLFGLVILGLASNPDSGTRLGRWLSCRTLVLLGEASYALYILHVPIKGFWVKGATRLFPNALNNSITASWMLLGYLTLVVGMSVCVFQWFEVPARRWLKQRFAGTTPRSILTAMEAGPPHSVATPPGISRALN